MWGHPARAARGGSGDGGKGEKVGGGGGAGRFPSFFSFSTVQATHTQSRPRGRAAGPAILATTPSQRMQLTERATVAEVMTREARAAAMVASVFWVLGECVFGGGGDEGRRCV